MPGSLSQADLTADLKAMLGASADKFPAAADGDFIRHLNTAALALGRYRKRTLFGSLTLQADVSEYAAPADFIQFKNATWGDAERKTRKCWDLNFPTVLPKVFSYELSGAMQLYLMPPPTSAQITDLGSEYKFFYFAGHTIADDAANTTVRPEDRDLLLLRALAAALHDLAADGIAKPITLAPGIGSMPKNGTASALSEAAMKLFIQQLEAH